MGYSPVSGRLHTRYSPVRRSPAVYCYSPLPLDLHVLSLSLAFILSQDQTLHSKKTFKKLSLSLSYYIRHPCGMILKEIFQHLSITENYLWTRTCCLFITFQYLKELSFLISKPRRFTSESGCKDKSFSTFPPNLFASFFKLFFQNFRFSILRLSFQRIIFSGERPKSESGCKGSDFIFTSKYFRRNFQSFFQSLLFCNILKNSVQFKMLAFNSYPSFI